MNAHIDGTKLRLKRDITSYCKPKHVYGTKGDEVILVTTFDHVCIVQDEKGERFSVAIDDLSGFLVEKKLEAAITKEIIHKAPARQLRRPKPAPQNTNTLF